jgi:TetR/AcrR family fatty acid metabolism transcriptional regulator
LLSAAQVVFAKRGFHATTIDDIAQEAGVAKGTVYLYFTSKQDIYLEALKFGIETLNAEMWAQAAAPGTCPERLRTLVLTKIAFSDEHRDFFRILISELGQMPMEPAAVPLCRDLYYEQAKIIEKVLQDGIKEGTVRKVNVRKAAFVISDLIRGIAIQRVLGCSKTRLDDEVEFIFGLLWKGIQK